MDLHDHPLPHYTSRLLNVPHGMFTSAGGVSTGPCASLNLSLHVGDHKDNVRRNRDAATGALGLSRLVSVHQVHGDRVLLVDAADTGEEQSGYDAMISSLPGTGLLIQQADCQAILLEAPGGLAVAAAHCGWRGSVLNIIGTTIAALWTTCGAAPDALRAVISPSLGPCCAEFVHYRTELPAWMHAYQVRPNHFDFWAISRRQLVEAGLRPEHIDTAGLCTRCNQQFFSYRRAAKTAGGVTGRNGSIIGLP
ncbi:MAG: peptidoglycan editing factor PgeF [Desulfobulbus sp.]|jgi:YfiH family protein|nr:peptidoglycan editing factor PgeF [Desulfobulbus sp.]